VAAGAVARRLLASIGITVRACTIALGGISTSKRDWAARESNPFFCPDQEAAGRMAELVAQVRSEGDTLGGIVEIVASGVPAGLGEPVFDKLDGELARALMSIGAVKGVEIGAGFAAATLRGSQNNDPITPAGFKSNNAGGILAGISSGQEIVVRVAVKPIPSISREQDSVNLAGEAVKIKVGGRHDIAAIPRINPVCEAMVALTLADHYLRQRAVRVLG
jgi:chorismate synthase